MKTTYYALLNLDTGARIGAFRVRKNGEMYAESFDPATDSWVDNSKNLAPYLFNGESGSERITEVEALALTRALTAA